MCYFKGMIVSSPIISVGSHTCFSISNHHFMTSKLGQKYITLSRSFHLVKSVLPVNTVGYSDYFNFDGNLQISFFSLRNYHIKNAMLYFLYSHVLFKNVYNRNYTIRVHGFSIDFIMYDKAQYYV